MISEVEYAIKKTRKDGAPGPDGITMMTLVAGGETLWKILAQHFTHYLEIGCIPEQWKTSRTVLIFKKGDRDDIGNF